MDVPAKPRVAKSVVAASIILSAAAFCSAFKGRPTRAVAFILSDTRFPPHLPVPGLFEDVKQDCQHKS
jgi:hypothetical protein